jgi:Uma2 family endonuclease
MSVVAEHADGWSVADLADLPDDGRRYELVDGSLLVSPPASQQHQELGQALRDLLQAHAPEGWRARVEYPLPFSADTLRVPDVVVFTWPLTRPSGDARNPLVPADVALVVEVVSPSTRRTDRFAKPGEYADAGIGLFWRLETDPALVLHPFVLEGGTYRTQPTVAGRGEVAVPWGRLDVDLSLLLR